MNIDLLSKMVKELILDNDKVALPPLGYFAAEIVPSTFSDRGYTINPPYRKLYFRQDRESDGLLARLYAQSNGTTTDVAARIIEDFIIRMQEVLDREKVIVFPELGRLRATKENNYFFVPDEDLDIFPEGTGLEPISLKTHKKVETFVELERLPRVDQEDEVVKVEVLEEKEVVEEKMEEVPVEVQEQEQVEEQEKVQEGGEKEEQVEETKEEKVQEEEKVEKEEDVENTEEVSEEEGGEVVPEGEKEEEKVPEEVSEEEKEEVPEEQEQKEEPQKAKTGGKKKWKVILVIFLIIIVLATLALGAFILLAHICPDFIDSILYTQEELDIINY